MTVKWKYGFNPEVILGKLASIRTLDGENLSFRGFEYNDYISVLKSMIEIDGEVSTEVIHNCVVKGFHEAAKKQELTAKNVIASVKIKVQEHFGIPNEQYWLVTTLNINSSN